MSRKRKAFTLIELLIVIAIIGVLSTLAAIALNSARQRSRDAKRVADMRQIQTSLELAFSENGGYPSGSDTDGAGSDASAILGSATASVLCSISGDSAWASSQGGCAGGSLYMGSVPSNPIPNGTPYRYVGTASSYQILFNLEGGVGQLSSGNKCMGQSGFFAGTSC